MILLKPQKYLWIYNENGFCDIKNKKMSASISLYFRDGSL
jgi:hypothetical protein